jgi:hypothetical protein
MNSKTKLSFATLCLILLMGLSNAVLTTTNPYFPNENKFYSKPDSAFIDTDKCADYDLNAGNTFMDYGETRVCNNKTHLFVAVYLDSGRVGNEIVKFWVGTDLATLPTSGNSGNDRPAAGQFPYKS